LPRPTSVFTGVEVDVCPVPGAVPVPAVTCAEDCTRFEATNVFEQLGQGGLRAHAPAVDLICQIADVFPACAAVFALEDREVWRDGTGEGCGSKYGAILEFRKAWVRDRLVICGLVDGVVHKEAPWFRWVGVRLCTSRYAMREDRDY
jgi:hypothetical protein